MAECKICGNNAGWFKKTHTDCLQRLAILDSKIQDMVIAAVPQISQHKKIESMVASSISETDLILEPGYLRQALASGWKSVSHRALAKDGITDDLNLALGNFANEYGLWEHELQNDRDYSDYIFWSLLKDIGDGKIPRLNLHTTEPIPLNIQRGESLIWVIDGVQYLRKITTRSLTGIGTSGAIGLGSGIYYGKSGFELHESSAKETESIATGLVAITNRHLYFSGESTYLRIRYTDIVATESYSDGIGLQREGNDGLEYFLTDDVWRLWNLIENLKSDPDLSEYDAGS